VLSILSDHLLDRASGNNRLSDKHASQHSDIYHNGSSGFGGNADSAERADLGCVHHLVLSRADQFAERIATSEEGVPAVFRGLVSPDLINAFATNRTKPNMNPPTTVPYITEAGT
jgi:hypothetical protein